MVPPFNQDLLTVQINATSAAISERAAAKLAPLGLDQRMISVLFAVVALGRPSQQQIVAHTGIDRTTVSKTIDRLESDGLVNRHVDPAHRRRNWIELTPKADRTLGRVQQALRECDAEFLAALSEREQRQLGRLLERLRTSNGPPRQARPGREPGRARPRSRSQAQA
jgi:DNA-binding MarR family transcriptional regulator